MGRITRELRSVSGMILSITFGLIITLFVLNWLSTRAPSPINRAGGWAYSHATGSAYAPAAPAMIVSPYSANSNLGPLI